jgi:hypothetical protein
MTTVPGGSAVGVGEAAAPDFWRHSGYHLLNRAPSGRLQITVDFLRAYLRRPEMAPVPESCPAETDLHASLVDDPFLLVESLRLEGVQDTDARENYRIWLRFRDMLANAESVEAAYLDGIQQNQGPVPPLFLDHLVQVILRGILDGEADPFRIRAAELLFRSQQVNIVESAIMLADEETVQMQGTMAQGGGALIHSDAAGTPREVELDVLSESTKGCYWQRSDRFDMVFDASMARFGQDALARVLEAWIRHFRDVDVSIQPVASIRDERWRWHVGLDAEGSRILNTLYRGKELEEGDAYRLLALFRLTFKAAAAVIDDVRGRPVYLGMAMTPGNRLRLKPQNILLNLPLAERS